MKDDGLCVDGPTDAEYFGNYKPGNYWIYLNRDSSRRDSMWVDSFRTGYAGDAQFSCNEGEEIFFNLHNSYLEPTKLLKVSIKRNGQDMYRSFIDMFDLNGQGYVGLMVHKDSASFFIGSRAIAFTQNFQLWTFQPGIIYPQVVQWGPITYAPNIGMIQ